MRRGQRLVCHAVVAAWLGVFLLDAPAGSVSIVPEDVEALERARVTARASEPAPPPAAEEPPAPAPPEPQPAREPAPQPPSDAASEPPKPTLPARHVEARDLAAGDALLDGGGSFPALSFDYEAFASFRAYARAMTDLGASFVVVSRREIVAAVDIEARTLGSFDAAAGYSPRARDYSGEPALRLLADVAERRFGEDARVMMLVPRSLDAGLFGGLERALQERKVARRSLREIRGRYERAPGGGVHLRVESVVRRDGSRLPFEARFDLGQIVRGPAA